MQSRSIPLAPTPAPAPPCLATRPQTRVHTHTRTHELARTHTHTRARSLALTHTTAAEYCRARGLGGCRPSVPRSSLSAGREFKTRRCGRRTETPQSAHLPWSTLSSERASSSPTSSGDFLPRPRPCNDRTVYGSDPSWRARRLVIAHEPSCTVLPRSWHRPGTHSTRARRRCSVIRVSASLLH